MKEKVIELLQDAGRNSMNLGSESAVKILAEQIHALYSFKKGNLARIKEILRKYGNNGVNLTSTSAINRIANEIDEAKEKEFKNGKEEV